MATWSDLVLRFDPTTMSVSQEPTRLPSPRETTATSVGSQAYLFGGRGSACLKEILIFDIQRERFAGTEAVLPTPRANTCAVSDGFDSFVFGGLRDQSYCDEIVRYNSRSNAVKVMRSRLPSPRFGASAAWDGESAYIVGGYDGSLLSEIARYDPTTGSVDVMGARLPDGRAGTAAVWDGSAIYVLGGRGSSSDGSHGCRVGSWWNLSQILRYSPSEDKLEVISETLPRDLEAAAAVCVDHRIYLFGGLGKGYSDVILQYDPSLGTVEEVDARLPRGVAWSAAVTVDRETLLFGGFEG